MNGLRVFAARVREIFGRRRIERELSDELQTHLDYLTDEHVRRGLSRDEARRAAYRDLGGLEQTRELVRERRGLPVIETLGRDIRFGARLLAKTPGFTAAAICTLALGIGANTAVFSVVDAVLLQPLPYPDSNRLVDIWEVDDKSGDKIVVAPANYADYVRRADAFTSLAAYARGGGNLTGAGTPERLAIEEVSASYFATLGVMPLHGRPFQPSDQEEGSNNVVILTHGLWERRFGAQTSIIDQAIDLDGRSHRVVGVMPPDFRPVSDAGVTRAPGEAVGAFVPLVFEPNVMANRREHLLNVVGRVKPGFSIEAARTNLAAVSAGLAREFPEAGVAPASLAPLGAEQSEAVRPLLLLLLGGVGLVLLIACANVASLLVARSMSRQREIAVRFALGATRRRVISELVTQSLLLSAAGTIVGLAVAYWTKNGLVSLAPSTFPDIQRAALDLRVLSFAGVLAVATGLLFGVLPAWQVSRTRPVDALRTADRSTGAGSWALRNRTALMAVEVALSTLLLVGAGLMLRSLMAVNAVPLGFDPSGVLATNVVLPPQRYATPQARLDFYETLAARVAAIPGVRGVAYSNRLPLRGNWSSGFTFDEPSTAVPSGQGHTAGFQAVNPEYFSVFKIPLLRGRQLADTDRSGAPGGAVVNAAFVRTFFRDANPLGQRLRRGPKMPPIEIVGVVGDVRRGGRMADIEPQLYLPAAQVELYPLALSDLAIRVDGVPESYADAVRGAIWAIDPNQPVTNVRTLEEVLALRLAQRHFQTFLFGLFAVLALSLAVVGVYSVVDYSVRQRTAEIGLRMALGANAGGILRWVIGQSLWIVSAGSLAGLAGAYWLSRFVRSLLFGIEPTDLLTYVGAALVLAAAALVAAYLAARRAVRVDPVSALR